MTGTEIYKRTPIYERQAREIKLHAPHWKLLLAYDGVRTLAEVALSAETTFAEALPLTRKFLDEQWIEEQPITLDQFLKRQGMKDIASTGSMVPPAAVLHKPEPIVAAPVAAPTPVATPSPALAAAAAPPPPLPATPAVATPPAIAHPPGMKPARAMRLSAVVDFITSLVGNIGVGQLLVYRVFLRVPPELLLAEDIASVHLAGDTSVIESEKLQKAISDAVNAVAQRTLPDSVFAPA
jgi:hypothetical protein